MRLRGLVDRLSVVFVGESSVIREKKYLLKKNRNTFYTKIEKRQL